MVVRPKAEHVDQGKWKEFEITHWEWRQCLYTPEGKDENHVGKFRVTKGRYEDGEEFELSEEWRSQENASQPLDRRWKGTTRFQNSPSADGHGAPNSAARWLTPRGPVKPTVQLSTS